MPKTRNEIIDEYFNGPDWSMDDDLTLMIHFVIRLNRMLVYHL